MMLSMFLANLLYIFLICPTQSYIPRQISLSNRIFNFQRPRLSNTELTAVISDKASLDQFKKRLIESVQQSTEEKNQLASTNELVETMTMKELQSRWLQIKRDHNIEDKSTNVLSSLHNIATYMLKDGQTIILTDDKAMDIETTTAANKEDEISITEAELVRLWNEHSNKPFGKHISKYNEQEALLLLYDEDDSYIMGDQLPVLKSSWKAISIDTFNKKDSEELTDIEYDDGLIPLDVVISRLKVDEEPELFISSQELELSWHNRHGYKWGSPAYDYSDKNALLQLCDDFEGEFELGSIAGQMTYAQASDIAPNPELNGKMFWGNLEEGSMKESVRQVFDDFEDMTKYRPAWKKATNILTPDIDTQTFIGDMMFSNTYLTTRIPANWDDDEDDEMSSAYRETGTMAWPGEPETDYNLKVPLWESLGIDVEPKYPNSKYDIDRPMRLFEEEYRAEIESKSMIAATDPQQSVLPVPSSEAVVDWENFDFSTLSEPSSATSVVRADGQMEELSLSQSRPKKSDLDMFYSLDTKRIADGLHSGDDAEDQNAEEESYPEIELVPGNIIPMEEDTGGRAFTTPIEWLEKLKSDPPNGVELVGYDVWSKYDPAIFRRGDEEEWLEDRYLEQAVDRIQKVLKLYLRDHDEIMDHVESTQFIEKYYRMKFDDYYQEKLKIDRTELEQAEASKKKGWGRLPSLQNDASLDPRLLQEIPVYLVPELHVGVNYTDTVFEMRNKRILEPERLDPRVEFKDDRFTPNEDLVTLNEVGTVRDQYDWLPQDREHAIDEEIAEKLQPVIRFLNHAAELVSTKDGVVIFNYKSALKHIIGLRDMVKQMAQECYPEMKDLRLETERLVDRRDC